MLKRLALTVAIGAGALLLASDAQAMPLTLAKTTAIESDVTLVRDGCGRGYRFSNRWQPLARMKRTPVAVQLYSPR